MARAGCVLAAALLWDGPAEAAPAIAFEPAAVNVSGMTPQGRAFVFGVAWAADGRVKTSRHTTFLSDGDGNGEARLDLGTERPDTSVWLAVDFEDGSWTVATTGGAVREARFPWNAVPYARDRLALHSEKAYIAIVRPLIGAWLLRVNDGGESDGDGDNNGQIRAGLASFSAFGGSPPPPAKLERGDIVLVVDPERLLFSRHALAR